MIETAKELETRQRAAHAAFLKTPEGEDWLKRVKYLKGALDIATNAGLELPLMSSLVNIISATDAFEACVGKEDSKRNPSVAQKLHALGHRLMVVAEKMGDDHLVASALSQTDTADEH